MEQVQEARVKVIFDQTLERHGAERSAFLNEVCAGDHLLRARVEVLLAGAEKDDVFLRHAPPHPGPRPPKR